MRWILAVLIALNLGFGGYQYWQASQHTAPASGAVAVATLSNLEPTKNQIERLQQSKRPSDSAQGQGRATQCLRIEGLERGQGLEVIVSRLQAIEIVTVQEPSQKVVKTDYQVIVGPFQTKTIAKEKLAEVAAKAIESYIISSGINVNALSMGVFSSETNALRQQALLASKGVNASIVSTAHLADLVSLVIDPESAALVADSTLASILSQYEKAEYSRFNCN